MTEDQFIDCQCPHCEAALSFLDAFAGTAQNCPECQETVVVPAANTEVAGRLPIPITTARLVLRRFQAGDWKDLLELMSNEEVFRYEEGHPLDEQGVLRWLETDQGTRLTHAGHRFCLGMELQGKDKLIGHVSITCLDDTHSQAALHLMVNPSFQRQGFGTETLGAVIGFAFEGIHLHRLIASCESRNAAACRVLEKSGLRREGEFVKDRWVNGQYVNTVWYALLREEYEAWPGA